MTRNRGLDRRRSYLYTGVSCLVLPSADLAHALVSRPATAQLTTARDLLERSFPFPLETDPADPTCTSNAIKPHLCGREELLVYLKVLPRDSPGKCASPKLVCLRRVHDIPPRYLVMQLFV